MVYKRKSRRQYGLGTVSVNKSINRYTVVWTDANGQKHSKSTFPLTPMGRQLAEDYLRQVNLNKAEGIHVGKSASLRVWINEKLELDTAQVRPSTMDNKRKALQMIERYNPELLSIPIEEITESAIMRLYNTLTKAGYMPATIKRVHVLLCGTFKRAYRDRVLRYNIMDDVQSPSIQDTDVEVFSWREIGKVFRYLHKQQKWANRMSRDYVLLYRILHGTGMRIGELLALQWCDIDLDKREIHVHQTISRSNTQVLPPKTAAGNRLIPILSNKTLEMLKAAREKITDGKEWVFHTEYGNRVPYAMIVRHWITLRRAIGIGEKSLHCWRHTWATNMLMRGFPITEVSRILGHASPKITFEVYSHAIPNYNQKMIQLYNKSQFI